MANQTPRHVQPDTIASMAEQLVGADISAEDQQRVAGLLNALALDMKAMRDMDVGIDEPAPVFEAVEKR